MSIYIPSSGTASITQAQLTEATNQCVKKSTLTTTGTPTGVVQLDSTGTLTSNNLKVNSITSAAALLSDGSGNIIPNSTNTIGSIVNDTFLRNSIGSNYYISNPNSTWTSNSSTGLTVTGGAGAFHDYIAFTGYGPTCAANWSASLTINCTNATNGFGVGTKSLIEAVSDGYSISGSGNLTGIGYSNLLSLGTTNAHFYYTQNSTGTQVNTNGAIPAVSGHVYTMQLKRTTSPHGLTFVSTVTDCWYYN
jgi:hypothetical protein